MSPVFATLSGALCQAKTPEVVSFRLEQVSPRLRRTFEPDGCRQNELHLIDIFLMEQIRLVWRLCTGTDTARGARTGLISRQPALLALSTLFLQRANTGLCSLGRYLSDTLTSCANRGVSTAGGKDAVAGKGNSEREVREPHAVVLLGEDDTVVLPTIGVAASGELVAKA